MSLEECAAAIEAEREACAKIIEQMPTEWVFYTKLPDQTPAAGPWITEWVFYTKLPDQTPAAGPWIYAPRAAAAIRARKRNYEGKLTPICQLF